MPQCHSEPKAKNLVFVTALKCEMLRFAQHDTRWVEIIIAALVIYRPPDNLGFLDSTIQYREGKHQTAGQTNNFLIVFCWPISAFVREMPN